MARYLYQLARFGVVGMLCFALGLAVLVALHGFAGVNYLLSYAASFVITNTAGYLLNARFTFVSDLIDQAGAARYMVVNAVLLAINTALLKLLVDGFGVWYVMAAIVLAAINTPISFLAHRRITYRLRDRGDPATL